MALFDRHRGTRGGDVSSRSFIPVPINLERGFAFDAIGKMLLVGVSRAEGKLKRRMT